MPLDRMGANLAYRRFDPEKRATVQTDGGMLCGERTWLTLSDKVSQLARVATSSRSFSKKNGTPKQPPRLPSAYLPFTPGDGKEIDHARGPDPFGMVWHSPSAFQRARSFPGMFIRSSSGWLGPALGRRANTLRRWAAILYD
jgi:hypothetical protein